MLENVWVGKFEAMDPRTEDLIFGGDLQVGMEVVIERDHRTEPARILSEPQKHIQAARDVDSRWCRIERFKPKRASDIIDGVPMRWFIGLYADGTKEVRMTMPHTGWVVKKETIPAQKRPENLDPRPDWYQDLYCELTGYMRHNVDWTGVELVQPSGQYPYFREQLGSSKYQMWVIEAGYWDKLNRNLEEL